MWADNAYYLPNYLARAKLCYTNTPSRTSTRAPGVIQSCLATGILLERVSIELGKSFAEVQQKNFIQDGLTTILGQVVENCTLNRVWNTLVNRSHYQERLQSVQNFNAQNLWRKRGISIYPVKYGIGWAGYNAGVQLGVTQADGTVTISHTGTEIGQGINTKVAQTVAYELGIDLSFIRVVQTSTERISNGGVTGGSGTSETCCQAAIKACRSLNSRLLPYRNADPNLSWVELLHTIDYHVSLNVEGWFSPDQNPNEQPFQYFVYGACVSEVELDVLSGEANILSSEIVYDCGRSLNQAVDIGQIEGGFIMGLGYLTSERVEFDDNGLLQSIGSWEYKPPLAQDIPSIFNVTLLAKAANKQGILRSKAVGEPSLVLSHSIYFALKNAILSARADAGVTEYFDVDAPMTIDVRQLSSLVVPNRFMMPI